MFIYSPFKGPRYNEKLLSPYLNALPGDKYTIEKKIPMQTAQENQRTAQQGSLI